MGDMKSIYTELALYGSKNESARNDNVLCPISEICNSMVSLKELQVFSISVIQYFSISVF